MNKLQLFLKNCLKILPVLFSVNLFLALAMDVFSQPLRLGQSVATSNDYFAGPGYNVLRVVDIRNIPPFVTGGNYWTTPAQFSHPDWTKARMRSVYGIALSDASAPDIYVSASTSIYSPCLQMAQNDSVMIFKVDGVTWNVGDYVMRNFSPGPPILNTNTMPNMGSGIGNICFDKFHSLVFATNMEDGMIYRIGAGGIVLGTYDPFLPDDGTPGFARLKERLLGIGSYGTTASNVKLYFSRWNSDFSNGGQNNEIWSVQLDNAGDFIPSTLKLEITLPFITSNFSAPVTDIEFSFDGDMLLGERSFDGDCSGAHFSRVLDYDRDINGNYTVYVTHKWGSLNYLNYANSCGGVDFDYATSDSITKSNSNCDSIIVGTGDYLYQFSLGVVYGLQISDRSEAATNPNFLDYSHFIDFNGSYSTSDKRSPGDVDVFRQNTCADTTCMSIIRDTVYCDSTGTYVYEFEIHNNSPTKYIEELEITVDSPQPPNYVVTLPSNFTIFPPVPPLGSSGVKKVRLIGPGAVATAQVCFTISAHFVNDDCPWCCYIEHCIKLPICGTCAEVLQDSIYCVNGTYFFNFTLKNGTIYDVTKIQLTSPGQPIAFIPQVYTFGNPILPGQNFPNLTAQIYGGAAGMYIPIRIKLFSGTFECCYFEISDSLPPCDTLHLNLTSFIQGRYDEGSNTMIGDTIQVDIRNTVSPYGIVETSKGYLNSAGNCTLDYYYADNGVNYYLVFKHRNSLETWSKSPGQSFNADVLNYDFLIRSQAYGQNLDIIDSIPIWYGIFSGDINQDDVIDLSDVVNVFNDANTFASGYVATDVTGDGYTDITDLTITLNNSNMFVGLIRP